MCSLPFPEQLLRGLQSVTSSLGFAAGEQLYESITLPTSLLNLIMVTFMEKGKAMGSLEKQRFLILLHRRILCLVGYTSWGSQRVGHD